MTIQEVTNSMIEINAEKDINKRKELCDNLKTALYHDLEGCTRYSYRAGDVSCLYVNFDSNSGLTVTEETASLEDIYKAAIKDKTNLSPDSIYQYIEITSVGDIIFDIGDRDVFLHDVINEDYYIVGDPDLGPLDKSDLRDIAEELYDCKKADDNMDKFEADLKSYIDMQSLSESKEQEEEKDL